MKIVIPGGSGQVGTMLARHFHAKGDEVVVLSRKPMSAAWRVVLWDAHTCDDWAKELDGADESAKSGVFFRESFGFGEKATNRAMP
jgi:NAD dependent epimerase/dehydratase family enzyme